MIYCHRVKKQTINRFYFAERGKLENPLYYWQREALNSHAEVDYVVQQGEKIIPIEVKSGTSGKMQSLHLFINEKQSLYGIRTSLENFAQYDKIKVFPLYAIGNKKPPICSDVTCGWLTFF